MKANVALYSLWNIAELSSDFSPRWRDNSPSQAKVRKANQKLKEANVRTTEVSKKIHVTKWNICQLSDCKIKQPVNMISGTWQNMNNLFKRVWYGNTGSTQNCLNSVFYSRKEIETKKCLLRLELTCRISFRSRSFIFLQTSLVYFEVLKCDIDFSVMNGTIFTTIMCFSN